MSPAQAQKSTPKAARKGSGSRPSSSDYRWWRAQLRDSMRGWLPSERHVWLHLWTLLSYPSGLCEASPEIIARDTGLRRPAVTKALHALCTHQQLDYDRKSHPAIYWDPERYTCLLGLWRICYPVETVDQARSRQAYAQTLPATSFTAAYVAELEELISARESTAGDEPPGSHDPEATKRSECLAVKKLGLYRRIADLPKVNLPALYDLHPTQPTGARLQALAALGEEWVDAYVSAVAMRLDDRGRLAGVRHGRGETPPKATLELLLQQDVIDAVMDRTGGAS